MKDEGAEKPVANKPGAAAGAPEEATSKTDSTCGTLKAVCPRHCLPDSHPELKWKDSPPAANT